MIVLLAGVTMLLGCSSADEAVEDELSWLFVQSADHFTLADGVLTLEGVSPSTLSFTDRPDRIASDRQVEVSRPLLGRLTSVLFADHQWRAGLENLI